MSRTYPQILLNRKERIERRLDPKHGQAERPTPVMGAANIHFEMSDKTRAINCGEIGAIHLMVQKLGLVGDIDKRVHLLKRGCLKRRGRRLEQPKFMDRWTGWTAAPFFSQSMQSTPFSKKDGLSSAPQSLCVGNVLLLRSAFFSDSPSHDRRPVGQDTARLR